MSNDRRNRAPLDAQPLAHSRRERHYDTASDADAIVIRSTRALRGMGAYLLGAKRRHPVVALAERTLGKPVLQPDAVRAVVGPMARIYLIPYGGQLCALDQVLGRSLALRAGSARIWWPGLAADSDPDDHPIFLPLFDESKADVFNEFARVFDLSRPVVRHEISLIEGAWRQAEDELAQARRRSQARAAYRRNVARSYRGSYGTRHSGATPTQVPRRRSDRTPPHRHD